MTEQDSLSPAKCVSGVSTPLPPSAELTQVDLGVARMTTSAGAIA